MPPARGSTAVQPWHLRRKGEKKWKEDPERLRKSAAIGIAPADYLRAYHATGMAAAVAAGSTPVGGGAGELAAGPSPWKSLGPRGAFFPAKPRNGRITDIQVVDGPDLALYAGSAQGGLWRMTDSAWAKWTELTATLPNPSVGAFAVKPDFPSTILIGTGEAHRQSGAGLYITTDGGDSWAPIDLEAQIGDTPDFFSRIHFVPDTSVVIASTWSGLLRSANGGLTWSRPSFAGGGLASGQWTDLVLHPDDPTIQFAVLTNSSEAGLYTSTDAGATWSRLSSPVFPAADLWERGNVAICRNQPDTIAVCVIDVNPVTGVAGVYRSSDGGTGWDDVSGNLAGAFWGNDQAFHVGAIEIHPSDPERMFMGTIGMAVTEDGGVTWETDEAIHDIELGHADFTRLTFSEFYSDDVMFLCNDGGVYWHNFVSSTTHHMLGDAVDGLVCTEVDDMDADRKMIGFGTQDNGLVRSIDYGATWELLLTGDAGDVEITDPLGQDMFAGISAGWDTFRVPFSGPSLPTMSLFTGKPSLHYDPNLDVVYTQNGTSIMGIPEDLSASWSVVVGGFTPAGASIRKVWGNKVDGKTLFTVYGSPSKADLTILRNVGGTWLPSTFNGLNGSGADVLTVFPSREWPGEAWVGFGDGGGPRVMWTPDYGLTWEDRTGNLSTVNRITAITTMPFDPDTVYVGTEVGVFRTEDGGQTWLPFQDGMPVALCTDLRFVLDDAHGSTHQLVLSTDGRGVWSRAIEMPPVLYVDGDYAGGFQDGSYEWPYKTVIGAVGAAPVGATVAIKSGTYFEPFTFARNVTLMTWAGDSTIE